MKETAILKKLYAHLLFLFILPIPLCLNAQLPAEFHWQHLGSLPDFGNLTFLQIHNENTIVAMVRDGFAKPQLAYSTCPALRFTVPF